METIKYAVDTICESIINNQTSFGLSDKNTSTRCFSKEDILKKHLEQEGICPICKEPMTIEDAQGGHKISYKDGGTTSYDNLVVLHGRCNRLMGTEEYKENG
jgi:5-methylcytosine-specific restriction endonuclease McrA